MEFNRIAQSSRHLIRNVVSMGRLLLLAIVFAGSSALALNESPQTFTLDGRLYQAGTSNPLLDNAIKITVQIINPAGTCLLYEEQQTVDTHSSGGYFTINVGSPTGASKRTVSDPGRTMNQIFQNLVGISANSIPGQTCAGGVYTPAAGAVRYFRLTITPSSTNIADRLTPDIVIDSVPNAVVAQSVQGLERSGILQTNSTAPVALTQANLEALFTTPAYANLQAILAGNFIKTDTSGAPLPSYAANPASPSNGEIWFDSTTGEVKYKNASGIQVVGAAGTGTISSLTVGSSMSLNGTVAGTISNGAGTIDLTNTGIAAGTYAKLTVDAKGRATAGTVSLVESDIPNLTVAGKVSGNTITSGTISGSTAINTTGNLITTGTISGLTVQATNLRVYNGANYVQLTAGTISSNLNFTLPTSLGSNGQVLATDGSGALSWTSISGSIAGDVSGPFGSTSVDKIKGKAVTAGSVSGQVMIYDGTQWVNSVVSGDASLAYDGILTLNKVPVSKGGTNTTSFGNNHIIVSNGTGTALVDVTCSLNQVLSFDASGYAYCANVVGASTVFAGDVSGTYNATVVQKIQGKAVTAGSVSGQVMIYNGTSWVNSVVSGDGTLATDGTLSIDTGTTANKIVRLNGSAKLPAVDGSALTNLTAGNISGVIPVANGGTNSSTALSNNRVMVSSGGKIVEAGAMTDGQILVGATGAAPSAATIGASNGISITTSAGAISIATNATSANTASTIVSRDASGDFSASNITNNSNILKGATSGAITMTVPATVTPYTLTWPAAVGGAGSFLTTDASGNLSWGSPAAIADSSYTVKGAVQFNTDVATSGISVASGVATVNYGTGANQIVKLDSSAKLPAVDGSALTNLTATNISGNIPISKGGTGQSTKTAGFDALSPTTTKGDLITSNGTNNVRLAAGTDGYVLQADSSQASGLKWAATTNGTVTSVSSANSDISVATGVSTPVLTLNSGTGANQIVKLDGSAKLPAVDGSALTNLTATNISGLVPVSKGGTNASSFGNNHIIASNGSGTTLVDFTCSLNQVISFDGSGNATCASVAAISGAILNGGNTTGADISIGTNDNKALAFKVNNATAMTISQSGNVGIGTIAPATNLEVKGAAAIARVTNSTNSYYTEFGFPVAASGEPALSLYTSGVTNGRVLQRQNSTKNVYLGDIDANNGALIIRTNGLDQMIVNPSGNVGIGTTAPSSALDVSGAITAEGLASAPSVSPSNTGRIYYDYSANKFKISQNGAAYVDLVGAGSITSVGGQTGAAQSLAISVDNSVATPTITSASDTHTWKIPMASNTGTTAGLLNKTDYDTFNNKLGTTTSFAGDVSGTYNATIVQKIQGKAVTAASVSGQVMIYNGTSWVNSVVSGDATLAYDGILTLNKVPVSKGGTNTTSYGNNHIIVSNGTGSALTDVTCSLNQVLSFDASGNVVCANVSSLSGSIQNGGNTTGADISIGTNDNKALAFKVNNTTAMTISQSGNVGIGTATPAGTLDVNGGTAAAATNGTNITLTAQAAGAGNQNGGNIVLTPGAKTGTGAAGGVLIGYTTQPSWLVANSLYLAGMVYATSGYQTPNSSSYTWGTGSTKLIGIGATNATDYLAINTNAVERLRIDSSGNIGIARTAPNVALDVSGAFNLNGIAAPAVSPSNEGRIYFDRTANKFKISQNGAAYVDLVGAGSITSVGGQTGAAQSLAISVDNSVATPTITSASDTHTWKIPMASNAGTTAGLLSKTDYDTFNTKLGTTTSFAGDVSGTYNATIVQKIQGKAITAGSVSGQMMIYDGTQWVNSVMSGAGTLDYAGKLTLNTVPVSKGGTNTTSFGNNRVIASNGTGSALTDITCSLNQVLSFDASGYVVCANVSSLSGGILNGGNSTGAAMSIGTNDTYDFLMRSGSGAKVNLTAAGDISITAGGSAHSVVIDGSTTGFVKSNSVVAFLNSTASTSSSTGALQVTGGVGVGGSLYTGSNVVVGNYLVSSQIYGNTVMPFGSVSIDGNNTASKGPVLLNAAGGNVGIGVATTSVALDISGQAAWIRGSGINPAEVRLGPGVTTGSNYVGFKGPSSNPAANVLWQLPAADGASGQVMATNASGVLSWVTPATSATAYMNGGNSFSGTANLGTNDNHALNIKTNNTTAMTISQSGNVGIARTAPTTALDVSGAFNMNGIAAPAVSNSSEGRIYYDRTANKFKVSQNGGAYADLVINITNDFVNGGNAFSGTATLGTTDNHALLIKTNNATAMTISQSGNVGIGTTNPSTFTHIYNSNTAATALTVENPNTNANANARVEIKNNNGDLAGYSIYSTNQAINPGYGQFYATKGLSITSDASVANGGSDPILFLTGGFSTTQERMRITSSGNVGIGTTSPSTALDVSGAVNVIGIAAPAVSNSSEGRIYYDRSANKFKVSQNGAAYVDLVSGASTGFANGGNAFGANATLGTTDNKSLSFITNNATAMTISQGGNIGIGTASPNSRLSLGNLVDAPVLNFFDSSVASRYGVGIHSDELQFYIPSSAHYSFNKGGDLQTSGTNEIMRINAVTGNVGIGNTNPGNKLSINVGSTLADGVKVVGSNGPLNSVSDGTETIDFGMATSNTWFSQASLAGDAVLRTQGQAANGNFVIADQGGGSIKFATGTSSSNDTVKMTLTNAGNLGLGVSPSYGLHVKRDTFYFETTGGSPYLYAAGSGNVTIGSNSSAANKLDVGGAVAVGYVGTAAPSNGLIVAGNVGIGTSSPRTALDVSGTILNGAAVSNASATIDMSTGNTQYTTSNCGSFQFNNLKDGNNYMFIVKGTTSATCSFTAYSGAGTGALTVHMPPDHAATTASKHTIYNLTVAGSDVYVAWTPGY